MDQLASVNIAAWLACLAFVLMLANGAAKLYDRLHGNKQEVSPQPLEVREATQFISRQTYDMGHREHDRRLTGCETALRNLGDEMRTALQEIDRKQEERASKLHIRIDNLGIKLTQEIGQVQGRLESL